MKSAQEDTLQEGDHVKAQPGGPALEEAWSAGGRRTLEDARSAGGRRTLEDARSAGGRRTLDGGWGWMCVLGCAISQIVFGANVRSFGVIYLTLQDRYGASAMATAWVGAINYACTGSFGPVVSALCRRFGSRSVTIAGTMLTTVGVIATGYAPNIYVTYVTYGLMGGAGMCMTSTSGFIIVGQYFEQRKALAMAISHFSSGIGSLVGVPVLLVLFETYGFSGMMLLLGGICVQVLISGALYRPLEANFPSVECGNGNQPQQTPILTTITGTKRPLQDKGRSEEQSNSLPTRYSKIIRNPCFISLTFVIFSATYAVSLNSANLPALAVDNHVDETRAAFLLSVGGLAGIVFTLVVGPILDIPVVRRYRTHIYNGFNMLVGTSMLLQPVAATYGSHVVLATFTMGPACIVLSQQPTIISDLVGRRSDAEGFGVVLMVSAVAMLLGRVMAGVIKDAWGSYNAAFSLSGIICLLTSTIFEIVILRKRFCQDKKQADVLPKNSSI